LDNQVGTRAVLEQLRAAIESRHIVEANYGDEGARLSQRRLRPVALHFWGNVWTLVAWCELRVDFRSFRADRFKHLHTLDEEFTLQPGQRYEDFLAQVRQRTEGSTQQEK
jgi:predicted DNA-binding transcriptional regulator YafY